MIPLKLAIVGSGPSAFYAAARVLSKFDAVAQRSCQVHMYERLPVPFGLVRYGVAPDHPEVKNCVHKFNEVAQDARFKFLGNVTVAQRAQNASSSQVTLRDLSRHYNSILIAHGASGSRTLPIPGNTPNGRSLAGITTALDFVNWYNGHPYAKDCSSVLQGAEHITVVGMGNVALDCARLIIRGKQGQLDETDIPDNVLRAFKKSSVKRISISGRRGPEHIAFTTKELRELTTLSDIGLVNSDANLIQNALSSALSNGGIENRSRVRLLKLLNSALAERTLPKALNWDLQFNRTPRSFNPPSSNANRVGSITWRDSISGTEMNTPTDAVIQAIGYTSTPLDGLGFIDGRAIIPNADGRVVSGDLDSSRLYTCGWAARGPIGVIAESMFDAYRVADNIVSDSLSLGDSEVSDGIPDSVKNYVDWSGWKKIDEEEQRRGDLLGKEREKICSVTEMLRVASV